ncbi:uncharacterized protein V6R79_011790 [Siganus canaliculatus]
MKAAVHVQSDQDSISPLRSRYFRYGHFLSDGFNRKLILVLAVMSNVSALPSEALAEGEKKRVRWSRSRRHIPHEEVNLLPAGPPPPPAPPPPPPDPEENTQTLDSVPRQLHPAAAAAAAEDEDDDDDGCGGGGGKRLLHLQKRREEKRRGQPVISPELHRSICKARHRE